MEMDPNLKMGFGGAGYIFFITSLEEACSNKYNEY